MLKIQGLAQLDQVTNTWLASCHEVAENTARGYVAETFWYILQTSPQYSGDFVANWHMSLGTPSYTFSENTLKVTKLARNGLFKWHSHIFQEGDDPAISHAASAAMPVLSSFKLGVPVYFTNSAAHDEPYAVKIESNAIAFRPVNTSGGGVMFRAMNVMASRYQRIGPALALKLQGASL